MASKQAPNRSNESGIALMMVVAAMSVLALLVTEFTYLASVNQRMAFDSLDLVKAHYLAKSGLKLSLLRLKAYQQVKGVASGSGKSLGIPTIPKRVLEQIWSFPFFYPIPSNLPGMTPGDKDRLAEFEKSSGLVGSFQASILSESSKYNLNSILAPFAAPAPSASPSPKPPAGTNPPGTPAGTPPTTPAAGPSAAPSFSPEEARKSLSEVVSGILDQKFQNDPDFAAEYRDLKSEDLLDHIFAWADRTYESKAPSSRDVIPSKKAPFFSLSELRMIELVDDKIYDLIAPSFTVSTTPGININTMKDEVLRALVVGITTEEVEAFFKFRDAEDADNSFKTDEDFFKYLQDKIAIFRGDPEEIRRFKEKLQQRSIQIVTDETEFKITVLAKVGTATRLWEAWVTLESPSARRRSSQPPAQPQSPINPQSANQDAGLKITFMRIL